MSLCVSATANCFLFFLAEAVGVEHGETRTGKEHHWKESGVHPGAGARLDAAKRTGLGLL